MNAIQDKAFHLSSERLALLSELARERRVSEDVLVERALDLLFERENIRVWAAMSAPSLHRVWDNEADAVYDDWKAIYGV